MGVRVRSLPYSSSIANYSYPMTPDAWVGKPDRSTGATMPNAQCPILKTGTS
ncbi:MAG: hypothetical protein ACHBN1_10385 [Heteroscytonema crispum UTEX LB 1556]